MLFPVTTDAKTGGVVTVGNVCVAIEPHIKKREQNITGVITKHTGKKPRSVIGVIERYIRRRRKNTIANGGKKTKRKCGQYREKTVQKSLVHRRVN